MGDERQRILDMVEKGTITAQEAVELLKAMERREPLDEFNEDQRYYREKQRKSGKFNPDDFIKKFTRDFSRDFSKDFKKDISKDFNQFGDRVMHFMQTSLEKLKTMEFDSPFGEAFEFSYTFTEEDAEVSEIIADLANGQLEIFPSQTGGLRAECSVKAYRAESEEQAKQEFFDKFVFTADTHKLRLISDLKTTQVNVVLYVPQKAYEQITARLFNGGLTVKRLEVEQIKVKTANGKIELKQVQFDDVQLETANGAIQIQEAAGRNVEAETLNGRIYIDGDIEAVEAKSLNGNVVITTRNQNARKIEGRTLAGGVELYIPQHLPLKGEVASNLGRLDILLNDVERIHEQGQFLQKSIRFSKNTESTEYSPLLIYGETKTGSVLVRYFSIQ